MSAEILSIKAVILLMKTIQKKLKSSAVQFSDRIGVTRQTLSNIYSGRTEPSRKVLDRLGLEKYDSVRTNRYRRVGRSKL